MPRIIVSFVLLLTSGFLSAEGRHPISFDDLIGFARVADPQISPDGRWVAYSAARYSKEKNAGNSDIWIVPLAGGNARQLTQSEKRDNTPRWSPDGRRIAFVSARDGAPQIWIMDLSGGDARKLTRISAGADDVIWSRDGRWLAFTSEVFPDCPDDACNKKRNEEAESSKVKARIIERLLYRHWDSWKDGKRTHIFVVSSEGGTPVDVTPGDFDAPPFSLAGPTDYEFSPDGRELCFARNTDKIEAISTNVDLWVTALPGGTPRKITPNPAYDGSPRYSPDGKYIAYRSQRRPGFEADRFELTLYDRNSGSSRSLTSNLDRPVDEFSWAPDSKSVFFAAEDEGYSSVFQAGVDGGNVRRIVERSFNGSVKVSPDGKALVFTRQSISQPVELYRSDIDGRNTVPLTAMNAEALARIEFGAVDPVRYKGSGGADIQAWITRPPRFDASRKYPAIVLIHGGPQGAWSDAFSYRWNIQMFASRGYVVFAPNPRGSTGFGQQFTDEISGDWGGKVYEDIMQGVDFLAQLAYVDPGRISAAGASYGGYMANWIQGHTDRFRCLVSHDGVYNTFSMYGSTEELWFPEWEFRGTPWTSPELYARWSPSSFVKNFKTPMLVIHGEQDFRVPVTEGMQLFTALQRIGIPSKLLYFPDEGHWVLKPQNSELWYKTVLDWIDRYTK
ncbi:MAG: S9 family peptidase [Acidobacteria bacterium]|nr:MAG: S9 family peptidase [Acidobacteriota bacterium]